MTDDLYIYNATVHRVVDGDTVEFDVDLGLCVHTIIDGRISRINAPEKNRRASKKAGLAAMAWTAEMLDTYPFLIKTFKNTRSNKEKKGKYGRWIVEIMLLIGDEWHNFSDKMVEQGHAVYQDY